MAELSVGKREVFTTASSLANRMGVVKGQTGDPVALASSQLGQTLDALAKQKAVQKEEEWKNNLKVKALENISKFAHDNRYDPANFMNQATAYSDSVIENAPKAFKSWSKGYLAQIITPKSNQIIEATWMRDSVESKKNLGITNNQELNDMLDLLNNTPSLEHTALYGDNLMPRLSEMEKSYEKIYNSLPTSLRGDMLPPEEQLEQWKVALEEGRMKSIITDLLTQAIEVDKQRIASGELVGSEIDGWSGQSAVTETLKMIKENMLIYEEKGFGDGGFGDNAITGPFTYTNLDNNQRSELKKNIESHADSIVNDHKVESQALSHLEESALAEKINLMTSGGPGSLNDTFLLFESEEHIKKYIAENFVQASETQIQQIKDSWRVAHIIKKSFSESFYKLKSGSKSFGQAVDNIVIDAGIMGITLDKKDAQLQLANHIIGFQLQGSTGSPYFDVNKVGFIVSDKAEENGKPTPELIALSNMAQQLGFLHPAFESLLTNAHQINIDQNPEVIFSLANTVGYLNTRSGYIPKNAEESRAWNALIQLNENLQFLQSAAGGSVMTKPKLLERYEAHVNPDATTLDEKLDKINRAMQSDTIWNEYKEDTVLEGKGLEQAIKAELRSIIETAARDKVAWNNFGLTYIRDMLGISDEDAAEIRELVPHEWEDLNFFLEDMMPMFTELVTYHLEASFATLGDIRPSKIKNNFNLAVKGAIKEMGNQGYMLTK